MKAHKPKEGVLEPGDVKIPMPSYPTASSCPGFPVVSKVVLDTSHSFAFFR
jgi:hypothetical protein